MSASAGFPDVPRDANAFEIALSNGVDFIYALFAGGNHSPIVGTHSYMLDAPGEVPWKRARWRRGFLTFVCDIARYFGVVNLIILSPCVELCSYFLQIYKSICAAKRRLILNQ